MLETQDRKYIVSPASVTDEEVSFNFGEFSALMWLVEDVQAQNKEVDFEEDLLNVETEPDDMQTVNIGGARIPTRYVLPMDKDKVEQYNTFKASLAKG